MTLDRESLHTPPVWHQCPVEPGCIHCGGKVVEGSASGWNWPFIQAVYCISLENRADRASEAAVQLHRLGICRKVTFYRPKLHPVPKIGIWQSHRAIAVDALGKNLTRVLVLEDDVLFSKRVGPGTVRKIADAITSLPDDWMIFFLGHWPLSGWFVRRSVLRTRSGCAHAYIAGERLLNWLAAHEFGTAAVDRLAGLGIDAAYAALPRANAYFPVIATQSASRSDHIRSARRRPIRRWKHFVTQSRHRERLLAGLMRPAEMIVATLSPMFYLLNQFGFALRIQHPPPVTAPTPGPSNPGLSTPNASPGPHSGQSA